MIGDNAGEMGENLDGIDLGAGVKVSSVSVDGLVLYWGCTDTLAISTKSNLNIKCALLSQANIWFLSCLSRGQDHFIYCKSRSITPGVILIGFDLYWRGWYARVGWVCYVFSYDF